MENSTCSKILTLKAEGGSQEISAFMFATGVLGNMLALGVLELRRRRHRCTLFRVLVTSLVVTDLAGTCLVSPLVQAAYMLNTTLVGMGRTAQEETGNVTTAPVCAFFGFAMTFFSLTTLALLLAMVLERCMAIAWPYEYGRKASPRHGLVAVPTIYVLFGAFCALPFANLGNYIQYCPGTWCFINMNPTESADKVFVYIYAMLMLVLVLLVVCCNCFVAYHLVMMYRRAGKRKSTNVRGKREKRHFSLAEEVEHLILLVIMTVIFVMCSLPLVIRVYFNFTHPNKESDGLDLIALRFISINSIIDPWVFIILSPSVMRFFWGALCKASNKTSAYRTSLARTSGRQLELCQNMTVSTEASHINKSVQML